MPASKKKEVKPVEDTTKDKAEAPEKAPVKRRRRKTDWVSLVEKIDEDQVVEYDISQDFSDTEAIHHKTFGVGVILKVLDDTKIEVVFEDNKKVLAQNWN